MLLAVVFDFDGVIANSEPLHFLAFQQALNEVGVTLGRGDYYSRYLGYDDEGVMREVTRDNGLKLSDNDMKGLLRAKAARFDALLSAPDLIFPGAADCIRRLGEEVPLAIASGALAEEIEVILDRAGLRDAFPVIVAAGSTLRGKPAPDPYIRALELLHGGGRFGNDVTHASLASSSVAIEDSRWGIIAARDAGMHTVGITNSYPANQLADAELVIDRLDDLTLDRLNDLCQGTAV
jgi:beta-phosphoglucomutase-like phosphatase (HAD superfamily)